MPQYASVAWSMAASMLEGAGPGPPETQHWTSAGPGQTPETDVPEHELVVWHVPDWPFAVQLPHDVAQHSTLEPPGQNPDS